MFTDWLGFSLQAMYVYVHMYLGMHVEVSQANWKRNLNGVRKWPSYHHHQAQLVSFICYRPCRLVSEIALPIVGQLSTFYSNFLRYRIYCYYFFDVSNDAPHFDVFFLLLRTMVFKANSKRLRVLWMHNWFTKEVVLYIHMNVHNTTTVESQKTSNTIHDKQRKSVVDIYETNILYTKNLRHF